MAFKKFADASSKPWFGQVWKDKVAAGFTNSASINGDKHSTLHYFIRLAMQHSMAWIGTGFMPANTKAAQRNDVNYLGSFAGLMAQSPSDSSPEEAPLPGDVESARQFGVRWPPTQPRTPDRRACLPEGPAGVGYRAFPLSPGLELAGRVLTYDR